MKRDFSRINVAPGWAARGLVAISLLVLAYAAFSRRLSGSVITPAMVFVAGGILVSDEALGLTVTAFETLQQAAPDDCNLE